MIHQNAIQENFGSLQNRSNFFFMLTKRTSNLSLYTYLFHKQFINLFGTSMNNLFMHLIIAYFNSLINIILIYW